MKHLISLAVAVAMIIGFAATPSMAAEATASVDIVSAYVWRGQTFNDGLVLQPAIDVTSESGFGINVWANHDGDDYDNTLEVGEFSEIDLTVSYGTTISGIDVGVGHIEYTFPTGGNGTSEIYLSLAYGLPFNLSVGLDIYYDYDELDEVYAALSVGYAQDLTDKLALEVGASMGYAGDAYCADSDAGLYDVTLSASLGYTITDAWSVTAYAVYVDTLDDENLIEGDTAGTLDVETFGGISIGYAF